MNIALRSRGWSVIRLWECEIGDAKALKDIRCTLKHSLTKIGIHAT